MRKELYGKLFYTKFMLLITRSFKRQKYIDNLNKFIETFAAEFDEIEINWLKEQMQDIDDRSCDELFEKEFWVYDFLKFGKTRLEVDEYNPEEYRTFKQFNESLKVGLLLVDYEKILENQ